MDASNRPSGQPSLEYHTPRKRLPGPAVWLGIPAVVFAAIPMALLILMMMPDWISNGILSFLWRTFGNSPEILSIAPVVAWFLGLLLGFAGMYLPKGNRMLPALALLLCVLCLAAGGLLASWHL